MLYKFPPRKSILHIFSQLYFGRGLLKEKLITIPPEFRFSSANKYSFIRFLNLSVLYMISVCVATIKVSYVSREIQ